MESEHKQTRLGRYELIERIATGGMAEIFLARVVGAGGFEKLMVIKRILPHLAFRADFISMFLGEARLSAALQHPNIVQVFDVGEDEGMYFIAMEYVDGPPLSNLLNQTSRLPLPIAVFIARELAVGLGYAHECKNNAGEPLNIIHRDISPSNVLVSVRGEVKLMDFGIAKATTSEELTATGVFKGKLGYAAPERLTGQEVDQRSDIFSVGVVLYELLSGRPLFRGANQFETLRLVTEGNVPPPSTIRTDIPPLLDQIALRALHSDREKRYQTSVQLADDLTEFSFESRYSTTSRDIASYVRGRGFHEHTMPPIELSSPATVFDAPTRSSDEIEPVARPSAAAMATAGANIGGAAPDAQDDVIDVDSSDGLELIGGPRKGKMIWLAAVASVLLVAGGAAAWMSTRGSQGEQELSLHSTPAGAQVSIDGASLGRTTPMLLRTLSPGEHQLELTLAGYAPYSSKVLLEPGESAALEIVLEARSASPIPPPASTAVVSPSVAKAVPAPATPQSRKAQRRKGRGRKPPTSARAQPKPSNSAPSPGSTPPSDAQASSATPPPAPPPPTPQPTPQPTRQPKVTRRAQPPPKAKRAPGVLEVNTIPWTTIYVDGKKVGNTPVRGFKLSAGNHTIRMTNPSKGIDLTEKISVGSGKTTRVARKLQ